MTKMNESEVKYLAGLLDADGSLSFKFCKTQTGNTYCYLVLAITAVSHIDRKGYLLSLEKYGGKTIEYKNNAGNTAFKWQVQDRATLNKFLPRVLKHMVIKAKHWDTIFAAYTDLKGQDVTDKVEMLKALSTESRKNVGPLKAKNHPTWAWVAGYLDGDGCYTFAKRGEYGRTMHVGAIAHVDDVVALELLQKAFGGSLYEPQPDNTRLWRRGLGKTQKSFAIPFLRKVHRHSRLKGHKIERMLEFLNSSRND